MPALKPQHHKTEGKLRCYRYGMRRTTGLPHGNSTRHDLSPLWTAACLAHGHTMMEQIELTRATEVPEYCISGYQRGRYAVPNVPSGAETAAMTDARCVAGMGKQ